MGNYLTTTRFSTGHDDEADWLCVEAEEASTPIVQLDSQPCEYTNEQFEAYEEEIPEELPSPREESQHEREYARALYADFKPRRPRKKSKRQEKQAYTERLARASLPILEDMEERQRQRFTTALWGVVNRNVQQQKRYRTKCHKRRRIPLIDE